MNRSTQKSRVLARLRQGPVSTNEFLEMHIPRFGARLHELRKEGWVIEVLPDERSESGKRYQLIRKDATPEPEPEPERERVNYQHDDPRLRLGHAATIGDAIKRCEELEIPPATTELAYTRDDDGIWLVPEWIAEGPIVEHGECPPR